MGAARRGRPVALMLALVGAGSALAQPVSNAFLVELLPYRELVQTFRSGGLAHARHEAAAFDLERLNRWVDLLLDLRSRAGQARGWPLPGWDDRQLAAAALLHLELTWSEVQAQGELDGASAQLALGTRLAGALAHNPAPELSGFSARWYLASGCRQLNARLFEAAGRSFERAARGDASADLALARGSLDELHGCAPDPVCTSRHDCPDGREVGAFIRRDQERGRQRRDALHFYTRALERQPGLPEARLRLGRTLLAHGRSADAHVHLEAAAQASTDSYTSYLAHLFLGRLHAGEGQLARAVDAYRAATVAFPAGQAARLALAHALGSQGDTPAETRTLITWLQTDARAAASDTVDPWWRYTSAPRVCEAEAYELWRAHVLGP